MKPSAHVIGSVLIVAVAALLALAAGPARALTADAAREFKVFFAKVDGKTPASYTVDHTAGSYVIDTQGQLRLFERYGAPAQELQADLEKLLAAG